MLHIWAGYLPQSIGDVRQEKYLYWMSMNRDVWFKNLTPLSHSNQSSLIAQS